MWGFFLVLVLINGIFLGFWEAIQNLSEGEEESLQKELAQKGISLSLDKPSTFLGINILLTSLGGALLGVLIGRGRLPVNGSPLAVSAYFLCSALLMVVLVLTFRRVGSYRPKVYCLRFARLVWLICTLLFPVTSLLSILVRLFAIPFGVSYDQEASPVTEEEIISMVGEAHEQGVIEENEAQMLANVISFNETQAHEIMTHRKNVIAFDQEVLFSEMVETMLEEGNSRYPVYEGSLDNIVGIVHYKDALKFMTKNGWARYEKLGNLPGLIRKATLIPETRSIADLFHAMQVHKTHMAIVVDEYGQTAGIVSMEDILEVIVGDILDEYDEEEARFRRQKGGVIVIDALTKLEEVEQELGISFEHPEFETLNGYLTDQLGHIPTAADMDATLEAAGYRFVILSLGNRIIGKVRAEKIDGEAPAAEAEGSGA